MKPRSQKPSLSVSPSDEITQPSMPKISDLPRRGFLKGIAVAATTSLYSFTSLALSTRTTIAARTSKRMAAASTPAPTTSAPAPTTGAPAPAGSSGTTLKYSLESAPEVKFAGGGGTKKVLSPTNIAELKGVSVQSIRFNPGALRELHWHDTNELSYCLSGQGEFGIFMSDINATSIFTIQQGSAIFVPTGATHYVRNTGSDVLRLIVGFSSESPKTFDFSDTFPFIPRNLLAQNVGIPTQSFPMLPQQPTDLVALNASQISLPATFPSSPFTVNVLDSNAIAPKTFDGGFKVVVSPQNIASLDGITVAYVQAKPGALREPHWHPNAAELAYFVQGSAMVGIIGPSGRHETFTVQSGDVSFVPTNYLHYIESTSNDPLILISFLSNKTPGTIEFSQTMNLFPHQIIAASFGSDLHAFDTIPKLADDVFLAAKPTS